MRSGSAEPATGGDFFTGPQATRRAGTTVTGPNRSICVRIRRAGPTATTAPPECGNQRLDTSRQASAVTARTRSA